MGLLTFVYSIPLILLVPILGMSLSPEYTKIAAAALLVYYPTLIAVSVAFHRVPNALTDVVLASGGDDATVFRIDGISKPDVDLHWNARSSQFGLKLNAHAIVLVILPYLGSLDRFAIENNAIFFPDFADCADGFFHLPDSG
jgi:hypothetical protein